MKLLSEFKMDKYGGVFNHPVLLGGKFLLDVVLRFINEVHVQLLGVLVVSMH